MNGGSIPTAVFDCMIYLQGTISPNGAAARLLRAAMSGEVTFYTSREVLAEVQNVLRRPEIRAKARSLTDARIDEFIDQIAGTSELVEPVPHVFTYSRDPKDEPYLNLAIAVRADCIVSRDKDLLDLNQADAPDGIRLRALHPNLRIIDPVEFLGELAEVTPETSTSVDSG